MVALLVAAALASACPRRAEKGATVTSTQTETIAPAVAPPAPAGNDAMTQTVEVEDSRSEEDGAAITNPQTAKTPGAKPAAATTKKPVKKH